jgi:hypothetical protein
MKSRVPHPLLCLLQAILLTSLLSQCAQKKASEASAAPPPAKPPAEQKSKPAKTKTPHAKTAPSAEAAAPSAPTPEPPKRSFGQKLKFWKKNSDSSTPENTAAINEAEAAAGPDLGFLLSMNYAEAKAISAQSLELPNGVRIAADTVEILKVDANNMPKRVRARGKVYLESEGGIDTAKVLCQEAYISSWEIVLRGRPIIQRGGSVIQGLKDDTVTYILGSRLRVVGLHRFTNPQTVVQDSLVASISDSGPWSNNPNPLLPPLDEGAVPVNIRAEMLKAAEAENLMQTQRQEALTQPEPPPAPWVKQPKAKSPTPAEATTPAAPAKAQPAQPRATPPTNTPGKKSKARGQKVEAATA